jgi:hypothetical protein
VLGDAEWEFDEDAEGDLKCEGTVRERLMEMCWAMPKVKLIETVEEVTLSSIVTGHDRPTVMCGAMPKTGRKAQI